MVVIKEAVRFWLEEQELLVDVSGFALAGAAWAVYSTHNNVLVLTKPSILVFHAGFQCDGTGEGGTRIRIDDNGNIYYIAGRMENSSGIYTYYGICHVAAGTYDIRLEGRECTTSVFNAWLKVGVTNFSDLDDLDTLNTVNNAAVGAGVTWTAVDQNIIGTLRECCIGTIRRHIVRVQCLVRDDTDTNRLLYVDSGTAGVAYAATLLINGTQVAWTSGLDDVVGCAGGNYGEYVTEWDIEDGCRVRIRVTNNTGAPVNLHVYWSIAATPWFMSDEYAAPILINIPQASNINLIAESLDDDDTTTKYIGLGTKKALSYSNVYNETSGTAIQQHSSSLTDLPDHGLELYHKGWRSCITLISADRRG